MNTTLTSRVLAGGTVAGLLLVGAASGVFGTFMDTVTTVLLLLLVQVVEVDHHLHQRLL